MWQIVRTSTAARSLATLSRSRFASRTTSVQALQRDALSPTPDYRVALGYARTSPYGPCHATPRRTLPTRWTDRRPVGTWIERSRTGSHSALAACSAAACFRRLWAAAGSRVWSRPRQRMTAMTALWGRRASRVPVQMWPG